MKHLSKAKLCYEIALAGVYAGREEEETDCFVQAIAQLFPKASQEERDELSLAETELICEFVRIAVEPAGKTIALPIEAIAEAAVGYALPEVIEKGYSVLVVKGKTVALVHQQAELNVLRAERTLVEHAYVLANSWVAEHLPQVWETRHG